MNISLRLPGSGFRQKSLLGLVLVALAGWVMAPSARAAKSDGPKARLMAKYDLNHNGMLDPDEIAAIRKDFAANPEGDLKRFDKDKDGKLSDEEIAAMVPGSGKKGGQKGGKKSNDAESPKPAAATPAPAT